MELQWSLTLSNELIESFNCLAILKKKSLKVQVASFGGRRLSKKVKPSFPKVIQTWIRNVWRTPLT